VPDLPTRDDFRTALAAETLIEVGAAEEMASSRDRARALAESAFDLLRRSVRTSAVSRPDSSTLAWAEIGVAAYARALRQEAVRLDRGAAPDGTFRTIWNEMVQSVLDLMQRWSGSWSYASGEGAGTADVRIGALPEQLILLCSPEAYEGESFALPREALFARMATLPESLLLCCVAPAACRPRTGATCLEQLCADVARQTALDALVSYRNGERYWSLPAGAPPRGPANDAAVARAQGEAAIGLLRLCSDTRIEAPKVGGALSPYEAGALLRVVAAAEYAVDPFSTTPGLRNPRADAQGHLVCDVSLARACVESMPESVRERLMARLRASGGAIRTAESGGR